MELLLDSRFFFRPPDMAGRAQQASSGSALIAIVENNQLGDNAPEAGFDDSCPKDDGFASQK